MLTGSGQANAYFMARLIGQPTEPSTDSWNHPILTANTEVDGLDGREAAATYHPAATRKDVSRGRWWRRDRRSLPKRSAPRHQPCCADAFLFQAPQDRGLRLGRQGMQDFAHADAATRRTRAQGKPRCDLHLRDDAHDLLTTGGDRRRTWPLPGPSSPRPSPRSCRSDRGDDR